MSRQRAFTLLELAIVLGVSAMMMSYILSAVQATNPRGNSECVVETRQKLDYIRAQIEVFARKYDRLPMPAARNVGTDSPVYGRESSGADIDASGGVSKGALPWQALGLNSEYAGDCWGNKFTYMVTTALTTSASSGGYLDSSVVGNISLYSSAANITNTAIAYAIVSHGENGQGAVKLNYSAANAGGSPDSAHGWCSSSQNTTLLDKVNCYPPVGAKVMAAQFNNGKNASTTAYFDDLVTGGVRPKILSVALTDSNAYCWGDNSSGKLGEGTTSQQTAPKAAALASDTNYYTSIAAGQTHTCAIANDLTAHCWGDNTYGQLGDGTTTSSTTAVAVTGGYKFLDLAVGANHTCGIATTGNTYCWGLGTSGQIGNAGTSNQSSPTLVTGGYTFVDIESGLDYTCAIRVNGSSNGGTYCWGNNNVGQLGDGGSCGTSCSSPALVSGSHSFLFLSLSKSNATTCGLRTDSTAYCWGEGSAGQIGDGNTNDRTTPTAVSTITGVGRISVGHTHVCAINDVAAAYCWGTHSVGLGDATPTTVSSTPVAVAGGHKFTNIAVGREQSCARKLDDTVYCWGSNTNGQLGDSSTTNRSTPIQATGSGTYPLVFDSMSLGHTHSCALADADYSKRLAMGRIGVTNGHNFVKTNGEIWQTSGYYASWWKLSSGTDFYKHVLPFGHGAVRTSDVAFYWNGSAFATTGVRFKHYSVSKYDYAMWFVTNYLNKAYYWLNWSPATPSWTIWNSGSNYRFLSNWSDGLYCSILTSGVGGCYGVNADGQLGNGTTSAGTPISGSHTWLKIANSRYATCGIRDDNTLWCWGSDTLGELGNATGSSTSPVQVGSDKWKSIVANGNGGAGYARYFCGIKTDDTGYCWGSSYNNGHGGASGSGTVTTPQLIAGGHKWLHIEPGTYTTCGVTTGKAVYCWGGQGYGIPEWNYTPRLQTF